MRGWFTRRFAAFSPLRLLLAVGVESCSCAMAAVTAINLFQVGSVLRTNPFGFQEVAVLFAAALCAYASWGFYRFIPYLLHPGGLGAQHPGRVAWWLAGGVWVTAWSVALTAETVHLSNYQVSAAIQLGTLLTTPIVVILLIGCFRQRERVRSDWLAWAGFAAGCTVIVPWISSLAPRL